MKRKVLIPLSLFAVLALSACTTTPNNSQPVDSSDISYPDGESVSIEVSETPEVPVIDFQIVLMEDNFI